MPVLYVPGNHEYDNLDFDEAHQRLRATCERLGLTWLEREVLTLGRVRLVGTTLWADFDALATDEDRAAPGPAALLKAREKAFRAANFYLQKTGATRRGQPWLARGLARAGAGVPAMAARRRWPRRSTAPRWS